MFSNAPIDGVKAEQSTLQVLVPLKYYRLWEKEGRCLVTAH